MPSSFRPLGRSIAVAVSMASGAACVGVDASDSVPQGSVSSAAVVGNDDHEYMHDPELGSEGRELPPGTVIEESRNPQLAASLEFATKRGLRAWLQLDSARFARLRVLRVKDEIPASDVQRPSTGGAYLEYEAEGRRIVVSAGALPPRRLGPSDVLVRVSGQLRDGVRIYRNYDHTRPDGRPAARLAQVVVEQMDGSQLGRATVTSPPASRDCIAEALDSAPELPPMTVVSPPVKDCSVDECVMIRRAWLVAQHDVMRARQMMHFIGELPEEYREFLWQQPGLGPKAPIESIVLGPRTSPEYWFGAYAPYRFKAIRKALDYLYEGFKTGRHHTSQAKVELNCPTSGADICFTKEPSAHHALPGQLTFCARFLNPFRADWDRFRLMSHELMHHTFIKWENTTPRWDPIDDEHTHGHGPLCLSDLVTEKGYGETRIREFVTYRNGKGGDCGHLDQNFKNVDTYAQHARHLGAPLISGEMVRWPAAWPTKQSGGGNAPEPCSGLGGTPPPPGEDFYDPANDCVKQGGELVCPQTGGGGQVGVPVQLQDLAVECPPNL